jgi:hypothetical protein
MRALVSLLCLPLAACLIESRTYSEEGGDDSPDATPPGSQQILVEGSSATPLTVEEGGTSRFEVTLAQAPEGSVTVTVESEDIAIAGVGQAELMFDATNWEVPQLVDVTGSQDDDDDPETTTVTLRAPSSGSATVDVTVNDDESQAVLVSSGSENIVEGGSAQVGVHLRFPPPADVTVTVTSGNEDVATVTAPTLTFTPTNYDQDQDVTIVAMQDDNIVQDDTQISMALTDATSGVVTVTVPDNDSLAFVVSTNALTVNENGTGTTSFTVQLSNTPTATVTATVAPELAGIYTVDPTELTFNAVDWNQPRTVTIVPVGDGDNVDEATFTKVEATDVITGSVNVTIEDTTQLVELGWPTFFGAFVNYGNGVLHAYKLVIGGTTPVTIDKWALYATNPGTTQVRMAIYSNGVAGPGNLIVSSGNFAISEGQYDVPDTTSLDPGTYWFVWQVGGTVGLGQSTTATSSTDYCNKTYNFATALPASWGAATCFAQYFTNVYIPAYR